MTEQVREALDRLADRREELARCHQATDLAAQRQREREEERRRREAEEAEGKAREEARARREQIAEETSGLVAELEGLADRILGGIESLEELDLRLLDEVAPRDTERANRLAREIPGRHRRWLQERFGV